MPVPRFTVYFTITSSHLSAPAVSLSLSGLSFSILFFHLLFFDSLLLMQQLFLLLFLPFTLIIMIDNRRLSFGKHLKRSTGMPAASSTILCFFPPHLSVVLKGLRHLCHLRAESLGSCLDHVIRRLARLATTHEAERDVVTASSHCDCTTYMCR